VASRPIGELETEEDKLMKAMSSGSGNVSTTSEILFEYIDYFDTSGDANAAYFQQTFSTFASLVNGTGDLTNVGRRIIGAKLHVLPKFAIETQTSSYLFLTSVPALLGTAGTATAANVRNTLIVPRADSSWVLVGEWKMDKLFGGGDIFPAVNAAGAMAIFSGVVLNPDSFTVAGANMQCRITVSFAEMLPGVSNVRRLHSNYVAASALYEVQNSALVNSAVLLRAKGVANKL